MKNYHKDISSKYNILTIKKILIILNLKITLIKKNSYQKLKIIKFKVILNV
jgi:hypothetical protein